jgi:hypothetical protein
MGNNERENMEIWVMAERIAFEIESGDFGYICEIIRWAD